MISEVTIQYTSASTLKVLKALSKHLNFRIMSSGDTRKPKSKLINDAHFLPGNPSIDISDLSDIITRNNMDASKLRTEAWRRNK